MRERTKIDVYSDKFETINIIDFEKLKKEALKLKEISNKYKQKNKILNILDIIINYIGMGVIIVDILRVMGTPSQGPLDIASAGFMFISYLIFPMLPYNFIKKKIIVKKRKKFFPQDTPQEIVDDIKSQLTVEDIEKILYINKVLILPGNLPKNIEYKILETIESKEKDDFFIKAYEIKANTIINYQSNEYAISTVTSSGFTKVNSIHTKHEIVTNIIGTAVQAINENKNSNLGISNNQVINS